MDIAPATYIFPVVLSVTVARLFKMYLANSNILWQDHLKLAVVREEKHNYLI